MLPSAELSKTQVDRLGNRLRKDDISEADLRLLDSYRRSFTNAYEDVVGRIRDQLGLEPTGRPAKSTTSISDKLRRESIRLSQVQDIAGCRVIVPDILTQDEMVAGLKGLFDRLTVVDRREHPSHGYRAVHVIVDSGGKLIEIQVRTKLQHAWAELSEKLSDVIDSAVKYGGGNEEVVSLLASMSETTMNVEIAIKTKDIDRMTIELQRWSGLLERLQDVIRRVKGRKDALSN
ncbi:MAG: RelA/SpoT domain-containing protein [Verrucomicrobiota bacterium]|nr:RelA/SpoT domain-containing protein [Verrucomicrobiota bacterium]